MVLQMPRPTKSHKTGIYYFRARYPADLFWAMLGALNASAN